MLPGLQQSSFLVSKEKADLSVSRCSARRENQSLQHVAAGSPPVTPATAGLPPGRRKSPKAVLGPNLRADPTFLLCETGVKGGASSWTHEDGRTGGTVCPGRLPGGAISPPPGASSSVHTPPASASPLQVVPEVDFGAPLGPADLFPGGWAGRFKKQPSRDPAPFLSPDGEAGVTDEGCGRLGRRGVLPTEGRAPGHILPALRTQEGFRVPGANHLGASEGPGKNRGLAWPRGSCVVSPAC